MAATRSARASGGATVVVDILRECRTYERLEDDRDVFAHTFAAAPRRQWHNVAKDGR